MKNYIQKANESRADILALSVRPARESKKIVTQMLDGSYSVQQIGNQAISLEITVCVTDKSEMDLISATCEKIVVYHYGMTYTGIISSDKISWEPLLPGDRYYKGAFSMVVIT